jgi:hypothetical protein
MEKEITNHEVTNLSRGNLIADQISARHLPHLDYRKLSFDFSDWLVPLDIFRPESFNQYYEDLNFS